MDKINRYNDSNNEKNNVDLKSTSTIVAEKVEKEIVDPVAQKDFFIKRLLENLKDKSLEEKREIVSIIMENSNDDGLEISSLLGISGEDQFVSMLDSIAHQKDLQTIFSFLDEEEKYLSKSHLDLVKQQKERINKLSGHNFRIKDYRISPDNSIRQLISEYYIPFLSQRNFKRTGEKIIQNEKLSVQRVLQDRERVRKNHYYIGPIIEFIEQKTGKKLAGQIFSDVSENVISEQNIIELLDKYCPGTSLDDLKFSRSLHKYESTLKHINKILATEILSKKLTSSLVARGYKKTDFEISQNANGEYEIVDLRKNEFETETETIFDFDPKKFKKTEINNIDQYKSFGDSVNINGKIAFRAETTDGKWQIMTEDGPVGDVYDYVDNPININGKIAFLTQNADGKWQIMTEDGPVGDVYESVGNPVNINGKIAFVAKIDGGKWQIISEDGPVGDVYDDVGNPININGKIAFRAEIADGKYQIMTEDGPVGDVYESVGNPVNINGKIAFRAENADGKWQIISEDGPVGDVYDYVGNPININGKIAFLTQNADGKYQIMTEDGPVGDVYDSVVGNPININGKIAFWARNADGKYQIMTEDGPIAELIFDSADLFVFEDNNIVISGRVGGKIITYSFAFSKGGDGYIKLTPSEKEFLDWLNLVKNPDPSKELEFLEKNKPTIEDKKTQLSNRFLNTMNLILKEEPETFFGKIPAKNEKINRAKIKSIIYKFFPEILINRQKELNEKRSNSMLGSFFGRGNYESANSETKPFDYLTANDSFEVFGGDPEMSSREKIIQFRENVFGIFTNQIAINNNSESGLWSSVTFPVELELDGPTIEITAEILSVRSGSQITLPRFVDSKIIPERVSGITANGSQISLATSINQLGFTTINIPNNIEKVIYSLEKQEIPSVPFDLNISQYDRFKQVFIKKFGAKSSEKISSLPSDIKMFIESIKHLSPIDKLIEIEKFVRRISYYDFKNKDVMSLKKGKGNDERMSIMEMRMQELKNSSENSENFFGKKYAGVCADFAALTTSMLREAGFVSGVMNGFKVAGKEATVFDAHSVSFVIWPKGNDKYETIIIDGTPDGTNSQESDMIDLIRTKSLSERLKEQSEKVDEVTKLMEKRFEEIEEILKNYDLEKIKKLSNGELEKILNIILKYKVRENHLKVVDTLLNAARYSGFVDLAKVDLSEIDNQKVVLEFLEAEIKREKDNQKDEQSGITLTAGKDLFETVQSFIERYKKDDPKKSTEKAIEKVEKIFELVQNKLDQTEKRAVFAITNYLKAKNVTKNK